MSRFTIIEAEQRSPEWFAARAGRLTGTAGKDMLATIKSGEAAARRDLRTRLVCERLTSTPQEDGFVSKEMQRGIDLEATALAEYEAITGFVVRRTGFLSMTEHMAGCSLDGDIDNFTGLLEIKCPKSATHLSYLRRPCAPSEYVPQLRHNMWVTGAQWVDFCSYDDRFPPELQFFHVRVLANELDIPGYEKEAIKFLAEVEAELAEIVKLRKAA